MMSRYVSPYLHFFVISILCGILSACCSVHPIDKAKAEGHEVWCQPEPNDGDVGCIRVDKDAPICPVEYNVVQCFFYAAELHIETREQMTVLRRALVDILELPLDQLREKRYAGARPDIPPLTAAQKLGHFMGGGFIRGWGQVNTSTDGFFPALKLPASKPALEKALKEVDDTINCYDNGDCSESE